MMMENREKNKEFSEQEEIHRQQDAGEKDIEDEQLEQQEPTLDAQDEKKHNEGEFLARLEKEHEIFDRTAESLAKMLATKATSGPEDEPEKTDEDGVEADPDSPEEIKKYLSALSKNTASLIDATNHIVDQIASKIRDELEQLDLSSEQGVQSFGLILDAASKEIIAAQENVARIRSAQKRAEKLDQKYFEIQLRQAGVRSPSELEEKIRDAGDRLSQLKRRLVSRVRHRSRINRLELERHKFEKLKRAGLEKTEIPELTHEDQEKLKDIKTGIAEITIGKLLEHYDKGFQELANQELEKHRELDEELIGLLNDDYIDRHVSPRISEKRKLLEDLVDGESSFLARERYRRELKELSNEDSLAGLRRVLKKGFNVKMHDYYNLSDEEKEGRDEVQKDLNLLPQSLREIADWFVKVRTSEPAPVIFQKMAEIAGTLPVRLKRSELSVHCRDVLERLKGAVSQQDLPARMSSLGTDIAGRLDGLDLDELERYLSQATKDLDVKRWEVFRDNREIHKKFGRDNIELADRYLGMAQLNRVMGMEAGGDETLDEAERLYSFKSIELAPFVILSSFRERRFLRLSEPQETKIYAYLTSLDESQLTQLKKQGMPGLLEIVELIKNNPRTFSKEELWDKGRKTSRPNPVFREIEQNLVKMGAHLIKDGDPKAQLYIMGLFKNLEVPLSGSYEAISKILQESQDPKLKNATLEALFDRSERGDEQALRVILESHDQLGQEDKSKMKNLAPELLPAFVSELKDAPENLEPLSKILGKSQEEIRTTVQFLRSLREIYRPYFHQMYEPSRLNDFIDLAKNPEVLKAIQTLAQHGYYFDISHKEVFPDLIANIEENIRIFKELKKDFPGYRYQPVIVESRYDPETDSLKERYSPDPYEILVRQIRDFKELFTGLSNIQERDGRLPREVTDKLFEFWRSGDRLLDELPETRKAIKAERYQKFRLAVERLVAELNNPQGSLTRFKDYLVNQDVFNFIARQPERIDEVVRLPELTPNLFEQLQPGGLLHKNKDAILRDIFENGNLLRRARETEAIVSKRIPYWKFLYFYTDRRIGEKLAAASSRYPVTEIAGQSLNRLVERHKQTKQKKPESTSRLESIAPNQEIRDKIISGELDHVPLAELSGIYKRLVFRDLLRRTIETSRSKEAKSMADSRNRGRASGSLNLRPGMYLHGSAVDHLESVLLSGNLPREALGEEAYTDHYPFHVDFTRLQEDFMKKQESTEQILLNSLSAGHGKTAELGEDGQIFYIYDRETSDWEGGKEYSAGEQEAREMSNHALLFGGIPSTEISAVVLRSPEKTLKLARRAILENGFYIPIYDLQGNLIFSQEEYDEIFEDLNLKIPVETWDYSLKTEDALGSNPGGVFTVPAEKGPQRYYVKYEDPENPESVWHLWNERLADEIYKALGVPVPDTKMVKVEGSYGRATFWLEADHRSAEEVRKLPSWRGGFLADALLANWDVPYAPNRNVLVDEEGRVYRLDNGGALLFHARGERKTTDLFGEEVRELNSGDDHERLGLGMRQEYPGLTDEEIREQAKKMKENLSDEIIDRIVDSVRLPRKDRGYLKKILRQRRDFILEKF